MSPPVARGAHARARPRGGSRGPGCPDPPRESSTAAPCATGVHSRRCGGWSGACSPTRLRSGAWRRVHPGVYVTHTGQLDAQARIWAAVLSAGPGGVCGPHSTLWLQGLAAAPAVGDSWVPHERRIRAVGGVLVRRRRELEADVRPVGAPPQLRLERAVVEVVRLSVRPEQAVDVLIRAVQNRRTTAARLLDELARDRAHPRRRLVTDVLSDVRAGVRSQLERAWVHQVERPHGLPRGTLNAAELDGISRRYRDVRYSAWGVVCELDGGEARPDDERIRDRRRECSPGCPLGSWGGSPAP